MALIRTEIAIHVVFLIGIGAVACSNRGRRTGPSSRVKLLGYYLVVQAVILSTLSRVAVVLVSGAVLLGGGFEVLRLSGWVIPIVAYLAVAAGFAAFAVTEPLDTIRACYTLVAVFDFASEIGGRLCGRTRFLPRISPQKTVEGLTAGVGATLAVAAAVAAGGDPVKALLFAGIVATSAFSGDLLASLCKRSNGIKDFSNVLPGQGGILDRFDSFLLSGVFVFALTLFNLSL